MRLRRVLSSVVCVLALAGVTACASQGDRGAVGSSAVGTGAVTRLEVTITGSTVTPAPSQVDLPVGSTLELVVTSDHDDQLHAHGFDEEATLRAGEPVTVRLTGTEPGAYEVETHEPALTLLTVAVR